MLCHYYITLRCSAACEFCSCWQNEAAANKIEEKPLDLRPLRRAGINIINITGGEPLLSPHLLPVLQQAKSLGLRTKLITNGIIYAEKAKELTSLIDELLFSLDYPNAEMHDRSRGVECFDLVIAALKLAVGLGGKPIIKFTLTRDSVIFLPEMIDLAEQLKIPVYLNPVYDFHGTQGFARETLEHVSYYARRKNVMVNPAALEFIRQGGNRVIMPRCRAKETTVTYLPDGERVGPCFFNQGGRQGREDICSSCMRWPYMLPSFAQGFDRYFWLNLYSAFLIRH
ncbi:radical SAM protein [Candidatus Saganbacteria bacterium]|nr:radical SAM protein [Candidatus Saganbacteria bacterium]